MRNRGSPVQQTDLLRDVVALSPNKGEPDAVPAVAQPAVNDEVVDGDFIVVFYVSPRAGVE